LSFSKKQIDSLIKLSRILIKKYKIKKNYILGHSDVAPDRKIDPGEKFPWKILYKNKIGIWHNLKKVKLSSTREEAVSIKKMNLFMKNLSKFGYPGKSIIVKNKKKYNKLLIKAFQRRFRPELINGKIDQECLLILHNLLNNKA
jgi:N-acetylmuramoyl-L-alanine amidase